jgi:uracil-DNA glycosylase
MLESVNLQDVKEKLVAKLQPCGWGTKLRTFMLGQDMDIILDKLLKDALDNKRFTPKIKDIFNAFEECPFDTTNVVIIGQDPYPQINVADGIAFSCSKKGKIEKSLEYMHLSIKKTAVPGYIGDADLKPWANQGVLLLNSAFTTVINKPGSHYLLWRPFIVQVLDTLVWEKPNLIYVFLGKKAQEYADLVPDNNYKIMVSHPASAAYEELEEWDCEDMWNKINKYLEQDGKSKISW